MANSSTHAVPAACADEGHAVYAVCASDIMSAGLVTRGRSITVFVPTYAPRLETEPRAMNSPSSPNPGASQPAKMPGEMVRALVSLWLLFHLFAIALAMGSNTSIGTSQLLARIKRAPFIDQYLHGLWLDIGYDYHLTYGGNIDADHTIEIELVYADGRRETRTFPPEDARGERLEHYKSLAQRAAQAADSGMGDSFMAANLGRALLSQTGAKEATFRIRRHMPLSMSDFAASDKAQRDPFHRRTYSTAYTASVTLDVRGNPQVRTQAESARDVAPVTNPGSSQPSSGTTQQPGSGSSRPQAAPLPKAPSEKPAPVVPGLELPPAEKK